MKKTQCAFTLVELSIVLVILELLIGGVLTGQSLIRAAELRSVSTQHQRYVASVHTFRDKYFALPGDMTNAQSYWGIAHATPATCVTTASTTPATCNGDGNGRLQLTGGSNERFRFWQHLANAGLIEGSYSGITQGTADDSATVANVPAGRISASLWLANYWGNIGDTSVFTGDYGNSFLFGATLGNSNPRAALLKTEEAYNIDTKVDDGKPATGKVSVYCSGGLSTCTNTASTTDLTATYLLSSTAITTALHFRNQF